ncbi:dehydrogenase [Bermanella sp. 47_1433_sub80_T6]|nr:dehydrogenase [Bermanella sp. 47_1433_sub80_T6]
MATNADNTQTHFRTCNLCEAMCGLEIKHQDEKILSIKGDKNDPFSKGYICPKATALQDLYEDPDRLRAPIERTADGWKELSWPDALDKVADGITKLQKKHGVNALGIYSGNPNVHNMGAMLTARHLFKSLKSRSRFSATSIDQLPHHIVCMHLFGHMLRIPVPDINRTQHMVIIGANPLASNGSIMSVANVRQKIKDIKARDGKVVVIDPRRTETADLADEHHFIRPGSDILLLLAMLNEIYTQGFIKESQASLLADELDQIKSLAQGYTPDNVASTIGIKSEDIKRLVKEYFEAPSAVLYGRMGVSVQEFGLLSQYLIMLINLVTGRIDVEGGLMFPNPAMDVVNSTGPGYLAKRKTRVRGLPDFNGDFPVVAMSEEMLTPGEGQIKAFINIAGNPVLSTPNGKLLDSALEGLEFMVSIDYYLNETSKHANIILPPVSPLERDHYDVTFHGFAVHNTAKYSPALFKTPKGQKGDWQITLELAKRLDKKASFSTKLNRFLTNLLGPKFLLNEGLKRSQYEGLSLKALKKNPHGIDLGPLTTMLPGAIKHKDKKIHLNVDFYKADLERVQKIFNLDAPKMDGDILLIGRRHVRSNNSWLHNSQRLVKGKSRCTLMLHPELAQQQAIKDGDQVKVTSRVGSIEIVAEVTDELMPGVVSIPHGWGHGRKGIRQGIAQKHAGVSVNDLTDESLIDTLSGNAAVNGVPVVLELVPTSSQNAASQTTKKQTEAVSLT